MNISLLGKNFPLISGKIWACLKQLFHRKHTLSLFLQICLNPTIKAEFKDNREELTLLGDEIAR